jgi:type IV secretion system protein TrbI
MQREIEGRTMDQPTTPALIQGKAPKPPGLLPRNVQSWLLIGVAFLMVAIMWLTGGKKVPTQSKTTLSAGSAQAPLEVNQAKIAEMQNRIQDMQRQQLLAETALAQQTRQLGAPEHEVFGPQQTATAGTGNPPPPEDPIAAERRRRAYVSLFSSNVALTYRKTPASAQAAPSEISSAVPAPARPTAEPFEPPLQPVQPESLSVTTAQNRHAETNQDQKDGTQNPVASPVAPANVTAARTYVLFEGTVFETVLLNRLDGSFAGPVECLLSTDVYSNDRQHLLVPAGSKLLGETRKVDSFGQTRLAVVFHRLLMPDGYSVSLDGFKGLNQTGDTGLRDQVNNHYLRIFGASLAIGALGAVAEGGTAGALTATGSDLMRQGFAQSTAQSSAQILDRFLNIMPTVTIREGHRVKVYLAGDLALPDALNHKMPSDL